MNTNIRLEEVMNSLEEDEFIGKLGGTPSYGMLWVFGKLDENGELGVKAVDRGLFGLVAIVENLKRID